MKNDSKLAKETARKQALISTQYTNALTSEEMKQVIYELHLHQTELEMQNEELRRLQLELDTSKARYFDLFDLAPVGYCTISQTGIILEANLAAATMLGAARGAMINVPINRYILRPDQDRYYLQQKKLVETGEPQECELRLEKFDKSVFWAHLTIILTRDAADTPFFRVAMNDISKRKQVDDELRLKKTQSEILFEERFNALAELSGIYHWEVDVNGIYIYISQVCKSVLGFEAQDIIGKKHFYDLRIESERASSKAALFAAFAAKESFHNLESRVQTAGGRSLWVATNGVPILDSTGSLIGYRGTDSDINEHKLAEEKQNHYLSLVDAALELTADGILLTDNEGRVTRYNKKLAEMWQIPAEILTLDTYEQLLNYQLSKLAEPEEFLTKVRELSRAPEVSSSDMLSLADGRIFECRSQPQKLGDKVVGRAWSFRDITDRILAEEKQNLYLSLIDATFESTADGILVVGKEGRVARYNKKFSDMWGVPAELLTLSQEDDSVLTYAVSKLIDPEEFLAKVRELHIKPEELSLNTISLTDGRIFERYSQPQKINEEVVGRVWSFREVTERKQAEEKQNQYRSLIDAALESTADGILVVDMNRSVKQYNRKYADMWRIPAELLALNMDEQLLQHMLLQVVDAEDYLTKALELYKTPSATSLETVILKDERIIERYSQPQRLDNKVVGRVWSFRDVTEQKKAQLVVLTAKKEAEAANRAKTAFLANMSHEIRTPMNAITGLAYLLMQSELTAQQRDFLKKLDAAAKNLLSVINDILDVTKMEAGKLTLEHIEFSIEEVLNNLSAMALAKAEDKEQLEIIFDISPDIPNRLIGDPLRFGQILINIVGNAIKFTEQGSVIIKMEIGKADAELIFLVVSVADTGIGMTEEQKAKLFQSFAQADTSTTRKYGGTGLGLAISKNLIELKGGTIRLESSYGKGSEFIITLPFTKSAEAGAVRTNRHCPEELNGLKTLVVVENPVVRKILERELGDFSFLVASAPSNADALKILETASGESSYKLVIMDWMMQGVNGKAVIESIRTNENITHKPKIIVLMTYSRERVMSEVDELNLDGLLLKPITASTLFDAVIECFAKTKSLHELHLPHKQFEAEGLRKIAGANVLLVEDNEINQEIAAEILKQMGVNVTLANNGLEALEKISTQNYDLALMDIQMPNLDGLEATQRVRKLRNREALPIVAMTAHAMASDVEKSLSAGMNDHLTKPIDPDGLFRTLVKWIKPREQRQQRDGEKRINFAGLKSVNVDLGLTRLANNEELYSRLLAKFCSKHNQTIDIIRKALTGKDSAQALIVVHTVKGEAGNLGAEKLQLAAANLEALLRSGNVAGFEPAAAQFEAELKIVLQDLQQHLPAAYPGLEKRGGVAGNIATLGPQLEQLLSAVDLNSFKPCKAIFAELVKKNWSKKITAKLANIKNCLDVYDFKDAETQIKSLQKELDNESRNSDRR